MINTKIMVFTKNSPWGVIKHPIKGNIYKHIINFPTNKKSEFISNNLCTDLWENEFANVKDSATIEFVNEYTFRFTTSLQEQGGRFKDFQQLSMSDLAMTQSNGKEYFWALKVIKIDIKEIETITFEAELDVFFTFDLKPTMFFPTATNFVEQAHVNRYKSNGDINWDNVLKNDLQFEPTKETNITKYSSALTTDVDFWLVVYVKRGANNSVIKQWFTDVFGSDFDTTINTYIGYITLPYVVFVLPFNYQSSLNIKNSLLTTNATINSIINNSGNSIFSAKIIKHLCIQSKLRPDIFLYDETKAIISLKNPNRDTIVGEASFDATKYNNKTVKLFYLKQLQDIQPFPIISTDPLIKQVEDPIIYHPSAYQVRLHSWNGEIKNYSLHQIIQDNNKVEVKCLPTYSPDMNNGIAWVQPNNKYQESKFLNTNYLNMVEASDLPIQINQVNEYFRDNKNQWETRKTYDRASGINSIVGSSIGVGGGTIAGTVGGFMKGGPIGAVAGGIAGFVSSAFGLSSSIINYSRAENMRSSHLKDLQNQVPSYVLGNSINLNLFISQAYKNEQLLKLSAYVLRKDIKEQLLDKVKLYGYSVNNNLKIRDHLNTRQIFNYIQAQDLFNVVKKKLSPPIKQIINGAFADGLTIWHYRDKDSWKGILNYDDINNEVN